MYNKYYIKYILIVSTIILFFSLSSFSQDEVNPNGYNRFYYKNGALSSEGTMEKGKPSGLWKTYYENGELKSEGSWLNGKLDSNWRFFRENGIIEKEISYNKSNIFINLKNVYGLLSILLLFLAFVDNLRTKKGKVLTWSLNICIALLAAGFLYHTYGMGMRWYLSGHAPWSNGYEALILVSWASLLAGFSFMRYSKITLAATSLLAFFTLMTASHSSYDPQLTNLVPVLKSYWLIIHVATLTISYGFLGLGFVLGLFNMCIYIFKNKNNGNRLSLITKELTHINEMNLTIGLFLATIGTFLGGVWANESWGRYWGWDAKETWALIITIVYTIILHFRLAPKLKGEFIFNLAAVFGFGSVLMTFIGVNYYFTKGMHSYASGETPAFPMWAWIIILSVIALMVIAGINQRKYKSLTDD